ncbi:MAG TPA: lipopolysaccharide biosynthesis protein, partial [Thermoanaerobaculia bacterium]|nr:lipopolysaccharide biosynthesis protein [Thermoanaerobaculia bacterium]
QMAHDTVTAVYQDLTPAGVHEVPRVATHVLDRKLARGITWTGGIKGTTLVISWASFIIVARILSPGDYGLVAMATVYLGLTAMITDFGLGNAIVALRDLSPEVTAQLHTLALLVGGVAAAISCLVAVPLSRFYGAPGLAMVIVVLSTSLALDSLRIVPTALLARELRFKALALLESLKVLIAVAFTLALAVWGAGYWALVLGNVFAAFLVTLFVLIRLPQRFARPKFRALGPTLTFSSHFLAAQLAYYGYMNADFVVAGRVLGKIALGEYTLAWNLTSALGDKIMAIFGRVMPTMLAAVQRDVETLRRYFLLYTEALSILIIPGSVGLSLVARDFILLVFGAKWSAAVVPAQLLCLYTAIRIPAIPTMPVLQVTRQASFPARWCFATLAILTPLFCVAGSRWGTVGIAAIWLSVYPLLLVPVYMRVSRTVGISLRDYAACVGPTLVSVAFMTLIVLATRALTPASGSLAFRFSLEVAAGAASFVGAGLFFYRKRLGVLTEFVRTLRS